MRTIDLGTYRSVGIRVFAGRARGEAVRAKLELNALDETAETVEVSIPADVYSVNSSFFLGLFSPSIRRLGEEKFREKYRIGGPGLTSQIRRAILDAIRDAIDSHNPLS